jgi:hypothetical protein
MYKVVFNNGYGGFGVSKKGAEWLLANGAPSERVEIVHSGDWEGVIMDLERHDPLLVRMVETLGADANGVCANLSIHEIEQPLYRISAYDGSESVEEPIHLNWIDARVVLCRDGRVEEDK